METKLRNTFVSQYGQNANKTQKNSSIVVIVSALCIPNVKYNANHRRTQFLQGNV